MKSILTRYGGKILTLLKKEGFWSTLKKVFLAAINILRPIGQGDILFISSGVVGNSWSFRVQNVIEELELHDFKCSYVVQEHPFLLNYAAKFSIFVFHRTEHTPQIARLIENIKAQNKEIIFETDDLLFDSELVKEQDFFRTSNPMAQKFYTENIGADFLKDSYVKTCTTTTTFLAEKMCSRGKKVFIIPNKLSAKDIQMVDEILKYKSLIMNQQLTIKIGYFSGEMSHNKDFAVITDALMKIMAKFPQVELFLAGPLNIEDKLTKYSKRTKQLPYVSRKEHFTNISKMDINLAPLEIGNPFCEAKSELKFFEAGIVKVPTVASATQTFQEAIVDGEDGFTARSREEWVEKLSRLITDEELRKNMGEKAHTKALEKYTVQNSFNQEYYDYLKNKL